MKYNRYIDNLWKGGGDNMITVKNLLDMCENDKIKVTIKEKIHGEKKFLSDKPKENIIQQKRSVEETLRVTAEHLLSREVIGFDISMGALDIFVK